MKLVRFEAVTIEEKCTGDKRCETVCPTGAIKVVEKRAVVDGGKCLACQNCLDACWEEAVVMAPRFEPILLGIDPKEVDQNALIALCRRARLHPKQLICLCSATRVEEVAAAVLKGAQSPTDIALMTGVCSGCTVYCSGPIMRLLEANGVEPRTGEGLRWHNLTTTLWDVSEEVIRKYPGYYLAEDKTVFRKI